MPRTTASTDRSEPPPLDARYFHIYKSGPMTVVGFDGAGLDNNEFAAECRDALLGLCESHGCQVLVVDLMEVDIVSSWILGVLAAVKRQGVEVEVYHPSEDVRNVMRVTHLDQVMHVRHELDSAEA